MLPFPLLRDTIVFMLNRCFPLLLLFFAIGCSNDVRTFNILVKNDTASYITINPAKDIPQSEPLWASPEDLDQDRVIYTPDIELGQIAIPPGKTAEREISGHFSDNAKAVLRIYRGKGLLQRELLAMKSGADRVDAELIPGVNRFIIRDPKGELSVEVIGKKK